MKRRALLGAVGGATLAATAGCLDTVRGVVGEEKPLELRVMRAEGNETDVTCELPTPEVATHPELQDLLDRAADVPVGEWSSERIGRERGDRIVATLESNCEVTGGIYHYEDETYFVSVSFVDGEDAADHHSGDDDGHAGHNHTH